ncbi:MAG: sulfatase-like hydrolase/transferase [Niveispirillum sp.]|uniref:sulfatase-like hydrolase/transferase n=1 Tax=Niveispirillum sp. TaxID=1917217 RepID=UPI003BA50FD4
MVVFWFSPWSIFALNRNEFGVPGRWLRIGLLLPVLVSAALWILVLLALDDGARVYGITLTLAFAISATIQSMLVVRRYGQLDGKGVAWGEFAPYRRADALIWTIPALVLLPLSPWIADFVWGAAALLITLGALDVLSIKPAESSTEKFVPRDETMFSFSKEKNVILIIIDSLKGDVFDQIISKSPELKESLGGFVYFPDTSSAFPSTVFSVPSILTGTTYDNRIPVKDYIRNAYTSVSSLPFVLKENGFLVDGHTACLNTILGEPQVFDNFSPFSSVADINYRDFFYILDLGLFRSMPHFIKPLIYRGQRWLFSNLSASASRQLSGGNKYFMPWPRTEMDFVPKARKEINVSSLRPTFKFYHLSGAHIPYWMNEDGTGNTENLPDTVEFNLGHSTGCMRHLVNFLEVLKTHGVYDNSLIIVAGDHGHSIGLHGSMPFRADTRSPMEVDPPPNDGPEVYQPAGAEQSPVPAVEAPVAGMVATADEADVPQEAAGPVEVAAPDLAETDAAVDMPVGADPAPESDQDAEEVSGEQSLADLPQEVVDPLKLILPTGDVLRDFGAPLLMVKPAQNRAGFSRNLSRASLLDIPATIFGQLGISANYARGRDLFAAAASLADRIRTHYYISTSATWATDVWGPELHEIKIQGDARNAESWQPTSKILRPNLNNAGSYALNTICQPNADMDDILGCIVAGMHRPEFDWSWAGDSLTFSFNIGAQRDSDLLFMIDMEAVFEPVMKFAISADGVVPEQLELTGRSVVTFKIPREALQENTLRIGLKFENVVVTGDAFHFNKGDHAIGPLVRRWALSESGVGETQVGQWMSEIAASRMLPQTFAYGTGDNGVIGLIGGWEHPRQSYVWSMERTARVALPLPADVSTWIRMSVRMAPYLESQEKAAQRVRLLVNGHYCAQWDVSHPITYDALVPPAFLAPSGTNILTFEFPDAYPSAELLANPNYAGQVLGVQLYSIQTEPWKVLPAGVKDIYITESDIHTVFGSGWKRPEVAATWSFGSRSFLSIGLEPADRAYRTLRVGFDMRPIRVQGKIHPQHTRLWINNRLIADFVLDAVGWKWFDLSPADSAGDLLTLMFEHLDAKPLSSYVETADNSPLSIQFASFAYEYILAD